jgi:hypothetical protein
MKHHGPIGYQPSNSTAEHYERRQIDKQRQQAAGLGAASEERAGLGNVVLTGLAGLLGVRIGGSQR